MRYVTNVDHNLMRETNAKSQRSLLIFGIFATVLFALSLILVFMRQIPVFVSVILAVSVIIIFFIYFAFQSQSKQNPSLIRYNEYEFFDEYFTVDTFVNGQLRRKDKLYYREALKVQQTENYLILFFIDNKLIPFSKSSIPLDVINELIRRTGKIDVKF